MRDYTGVVAACNSARESAVNRTPAELKTRLVLNVIDLASRCTGYITFATWLTTHFWNW